jgi:hypothetical protein
MRATPSKQACVHGCCIRDLTRSDEVKLPQEFLAQMLGARRTAVLVVAGTLQKAGFVNTAADRRHLG